MILKLTKKIYQKNSILNAIKEYSKLTDITMKEDDDYFYLDFQNCHFNAKMTISEFENYLIEMDQ